MYNSVNFVFPETVMKPKERWLESSMSARHDIRLYLLLAIGLIFVLVGATTDPSKNCSEDGMECAPWLIYVAFFVGLLVVIGAISGLIANHKWGYRLSLDERRLYWWQTIISPEQHSFSLDDVSLIKVVVESESSDKIYFYDRSGETLSFPSDGVAPAACEDWAHFIGDKFPNIKIEIQE